MAIDLSRGIVNEKLYAQQIVFYREHLDIFIEEIFAPIRLKDVQKIIAREFGRCGELKIVQNRGMGKSFLVAQCCAAMCVLYPGTLCAVCSGTAEQATIVMQKLQAQARNPNILREIEVAGQRPVQLSRNKGICNFKNGSKMESYSQGTLRGNRAKIVVVDESPEVAQESLDAVVAPLKNFKRDVCQTYGIPDYASKTVNISSACMKSNYFYTDFVRVMREMAHGNDEVFACALDYRSAARVGITDMQFFETERKRMPASSFDSEYGSIFIGAEADSLFPYDLTETCRTQKRVEYSMPKGGKSEYVMGVDLATSSDKHADNAVISVQKLIEKSDGSYLKKLVYMRSYHGKRLDALADEVRKTYVRFPGVCKIVFDHRGLGDAFPQFLSQPWTDPASGKEYAPWVLDDERCVIHNAKPLLRSVKGNAQVNQQMATSLRVAQEQRTIEQPVSSRAIVSGKLAMEDEGEDAEGNAPKEHALTLHEKAIYLEADAQQVELGTVVMRVSASGNFLYDTAKTNQRKDRYSSLAMAVRYIAELEEARKKRLTLYSGGMVIGVVSRM